MDGIKKTNTDTEPYTGYVFPGTSSEEQDENDARFAAMNPSCFTNLQDNFICQLRLDKPLEFRKPVSINEQVFVCEWLRAFLVMINGVVVDLGRVCTCPKMTAGPNWEFKCSSHPKTMSCSATEYSVHTIETIELLITNPTFYSSRENVSQKGFSAFANMARRPYRIFAHLYYHHQELFARYKILCENFEKFCLQFKLFKKEDILTKGK